MAGLITLFQISGTLIFNFSGQRSHAAGHKEKELNKWENINNKHTFKLPSKNCKNNKAVSERFRE